jgi:hypothetical protein
MSHGFGHGTLKTKQNNTQATITADQTATVQMGVKKTVYLHTNHQQK